MRNSYHYHIDHNAPCIVICVKIVNSFITVEEGSGMLCALYLTTDQTRMT